MEQNTLTRGTVGASAQGSMHAAGEKALEKASSQMMALAARRLLSHSLLSERLGSCVCRVGDERYSAKGMLEQKAEGATAGDAAKLSLYDAANIVLGDIMLGITLLGYVDPSLSNGKAYSAADAIKDYVLRNPNNWPIANRNEARPETAARADAGPDAAGWAHAIGHL